MASTADQWTADETSDGDSHSLSRLQASAHALADRLPDLLIEAKRISQTVAHGIHGRRRAGPGETFWQFRHMKARTARS